MAMAREFTSALEAQVRRQLRSQRVGYLLGAGSSYLDGAGYPLANGLWDRLKPLIRSDTERADIQARIDGGAESLEAALDLLDMGLPVEGPHRHSITRALAELFEPLDPFSGAHIEFVDRISQRAEPCVKVFSLNYDPLIERAAERTRVRLVDGFLGHEHAFFNPAVFSETPLQYRGPKARPSLHPAGIPVHLYKLHGSLGWYECPERGVRRSGFSVPLPPNVTRLMVPPQHRKVSEVTRAAYSPLWTAYRGAMSLDPKPLMRLASIGYGFLDEHVNDVVESALTRPDFRLLVFAKQLSERAWSRWSCRPNAIVITEGRCSLEGQAGPGHPELWKFERLAKEV